MGSLLGAPRLPDGPGPRRATDVKEAIMPAIQSLEPQVASPHSSQPAALMSLRTPRRIIGRERQKAHLAERRECVRNVPKVATKHKEPADLDRIDTPVLSIEGVARLLFCSVDHVRSIPDFELPRSTGLGKRFQYLRSDVIELVQRRQNQSDMNSRSFDDLLNSEAENVRRHSP